MSQSNMSSWQQVYSLYQHPYEVIRRDKPHQMWVALEHPAPCGEEELTIMMCAAGICGTDLRVYTGERPVPAGRIGHEGFAIIIDVGSKARERGYKKGMFVVIDCNHPDPQKRDLHLDGVLGRFYRVPADFVTCEPQRRIIPIDSELRSGCISPATAALIEPMTVALHALDYLKRGGPKPRAFYDHIPPAADLISPEEVNRVQGKNILITGAGNIAVFAALLARVNQTKSITLVNRDPARLAHAVKVAKPDYFFEDDDNVSERLRLHFQERGGVDYVLIASHASAVKKATDYINPYGTILLVAGIGKEEILHTDTGAIELYPIRHDDLEREVVVHGKPLKLMGAHGTTQPLFHQVLSYLVQGAFAKEGLNPLEQVTHVVSLAALPEVFALATGGNTIRGRLTGKILIDFRLAGVGIYTIDEYTLAFPQASKEFFTGEGIRAVEHYDARRVRVKNTFSSIRTSMDALEVTLQERYLAARHEEWSTRERKLLEKAFLVANDAYQGMNKARRFRPDGTRFIFHPLEMAEYAISHLAVVDPTIIAAILLHDVAEYTELDARYLNEQFGHVVSDIACDLAQDRSFEMMPLEQVIGYLQTNVLTPLSEMGERGEIVNLAIKNEHYTRLLKTPRHPLSPILKVLDVYSNYSFVRDLPPYYLRHRSRGELLLFRTFLEECIGQYTLPQVLLEDVKRVIALYERVQV
jgi:threonine dehydrogenase-like Zn-dependent dehydrogenase